MVTPAMNMLAVTNTAGGRRAEPLETPDEQIPRSDHFRERWSMRASWISTLFTSRSSPMSTRPVRADIFGGACKQGGFPVGIQ